MQAVNDLPKVNRPTGPKTVEDVFGLVGTFLNREVEPSADFFT